MTLGLLVKYLNTMESDDPPATVRKFLATSLAAEGDVTEPDGSDEFHSSVADRSNGSHDELQRLLKPSGRI